MRFSLASLLNAAVSLASVVATGAVLAQGGGASGGGKARSAGDDSRSFLLSLPVVSLSGETLGHMEYNLGGQGTLGIEGGVQNKNERIPEKERLVSGESLVTSAISAGLIVSRYTDPMSMGGFYWTLGVGYREMAAKWSVKPEENDQGIGLVDANTGRLNHDATLKGTTATARFGYRYVGTDIPMAIGIYLGAQHFQATVHDNEHKNADGTDDASSGDESAAYSNMTELEKERLKKSFMTAAQAALEVGVVF